MPASHALSLASGTQDKAWANETELTVERPPPTRLRILGLMNDYSRISAKASPAQWRRYSNSVLVQRRRCMNNAIYCHCCWSRVDYF